MSAQHTPGPWNVRTLENFGFNVVHYVNGDKFDIQRVAKTATSGDARLIAAAPDLLEVAEQAVGLLDRLLGFVPGEEMDITDVRATLVERHGFYHAAIAKARGAA